MLDDLRARIAATLLTAVLVGGCLLDESTPEVCYSCGDRITDPAKLDQIERARGALLGIWELEARLTGRDDVDRPLPLGEVVWELEIIAIAPVSAALENASYQWRGVLRARSLCLVELEAFTREGGECTTLEPVELGYCRGHTCDRYREREIEGSYDVDGDRFNLDRFSGDVYALDPLAGYVNLDIQIDLDLRLGQSVTPRGCEGWCSFSLNPEGLLEAEYPELDSDAWETTLTWIAETSRLPQESYDQEPETITIGDQSATEEVLLGDWNVRLRFESRDDADRPVTVGHANYGLQIFEVEPLSPVGEWSWKGALSAADLCLVSDQEVEGGTYQCDLFGPARTGYCGGADCEDRGEVAVEGTFNDLDGALHIDYASGDLYVRDAEQGYIYLDTSVFLASAPLVAQRVDATLFESWADWSFRVAGAFEQTHATRWQPSAKYFEMWR